MSRVHLDPARASVRGGDGLRFETEARREVYLPDSVGNAAVMMLESALYAWFAGEREAAWPVIRKAHDWLIDSIARREMFGEVPEASLARSLSACALAGWLVTGGAEERRFAAAVDGHEVAWHALERGDQLGGQASRRSFLSRTLRDCVAAREFARGLELFRAFGGPLLATLAPAGAVLRVVYGACADPQAFRALRFEPGSPAGEAIAGELDLRLSMGQGAAAAAWMKFAFWDTGAESTTEAALQRGLDLISRS